MFKQLFSIFQTNTSQKDNTKVKSSKKSPKVSYANEFTDILTLFFDDSIISSLKVTSTKNTINVKCPNSIMAHELNERKGILQNLLDEKLESHTIQEIQFS